MAVISEHSGPQIAVPSATMTVFSLGAKVSGNDSVVSNMTASVVVSSHLSVWVVGVITIILLGLLPVIGVGIIPLVKRRTYHRIMAFFVALGVGSLTGNSVFNLIPQVARHSCENRADRRLA